MSQKRNNNQKYTMKKIVTIVVALIALMTGAISTGQFQHVVHEMNLPVGNLFSEEVAQQSVSYDHLLESIPEFSGTPYVEVNNNIPMFTDKDKKRTDPFETYSNLDSLGRCGVAYANICEELMPEDDRGDISNVKPSGWIQKKYKINGKEVFLYNRSHLIAYSLAGENDNERNLITGTDYMNHDGMIPFETTVRDYINDNPSKHVLYRVTPVFEGNDLVAKGVLMEAWSVESNGYDVQFCVFCYNVQPSNTKGTNYKLIDIDYATGKSRKPR